MDSQTPRQGAPKGQPVTPERPDRTAWNQRTWRRAVYQATKLTPTQSYVLLYLADEHSTWTTGDNIYPSCATIGQNLRMSRQAATAHVRALVDAGWLVTVRPATKRAPACYRLGFGDHHPIPQTQPQVASHHGQTQAQVASDASPGCVETQPQVARTKSSNAVPNSLSRTTTPNTSPDQPTPTAEREGFNNFIQAYPHAQSRTGGGRVNAEGAYAAAIAAGVGHDAILEAVGGDPDCRGVWANVWLDELAGRRAVRACSWGPVSAPYVYADEDLGVAVG